MNNYFKDTLFQKETNLKHFSFEIRDIQLRISILYNEQKIHKIILHDPKEILSEKTKKKILSITSDF
ncbi:MAG: hypothetical protein NZ853_07495 [Leptospiraceae bacterium]|nr:hypothetical protein [Leptospiraceae bacterium]